MPVRQMKLRFTAKPTTRVVPSLLVPEPRQKGKSGGNKDASGGTLAAPILGVAGLPSSAAAETPPAPGSG
jgi:hypothetical protein